MIAAIYARKSTDQNGVADAERSVTRQIDHATQYAVGKGWTVAEAHIYQDDGVSGAEFKTRPGFVRLMNALKPKPPFQVLIMSEESRLGREAIETAYALKQLITAGVRVFFYLEDRERTLDGPMDKVMLSLTTFADELEREKARQRTYDAMVRKAKAGHVTGGRVFGYDNVPVYGETDAKGRKKRLHVERQINEAEAAVVVEIFEHCAKGWGMRRIAKHLNDHDAVAPRSQQGRPRAWAPSSVREVLYRDLYRGEIVWNKSRKRNTWGQTQQHARDEAEWVRVPAPQLRIVDEKLWGDVHRRLGHARDHYLRGTKGQLWGRPASGIESKYFLPGLARCGECGGSLYVKSRSHGRKRAYYYGCTSYHLRGRKVCTNNLEISMEVTDRAVLAAFERDVLRPEVVKEAVSRAVTALLPTEQTAVRKETLEAELRGVETELTRMTAAIAAGGELDPLVIGIKERVARRDDLQKQLAAVKQESTLRESDVPRLTAELEAKLGDWRGLLTRRIPQARQIVKTLLVGHLTFTPTADRGWEFTGQGSFSKFLPVQIWWRPQRDSNPCFSLERATS